jgi:hypothetical protein
MRNLSIFISLSLLSLSFSCKKDADLNFLGPDFERLLYAEGLIQSSGTQAEQFDFTVGRIDTIQSFSSLDKLPRVIGMHSKIDNRIDGKYRAWSGVETADQLGYLLIGIRNPAEVSGASSSAGIWDLATVNSTFFPGKTFQIGYEPDQAVLALNTTQLFPNRPEAAYITQSILNSNNQVLVVAVDEFDYTAGGVNIADTRKGKRITLRFSALLNEPVLLNGPIQITQGEMTMVVEYTN